MSTASLSPRLLALGRGLGIDPRSVAAPRPLDVRVDGLDLRCYDWDGPATRTVVLVHGGGLTARTWDLVALGLRDEYRCVTVDLRGHGDSGWPADGDYALESYARDLAGVLDALELPAPVLVGNSLGGQASLLCAAARADVGGLVLVDVGPDPEERGTDAIVRFVTADTRFASLDEAVASALAFNPRRDAETLRESLVQNLRRLPDGGWTWKYDARAFRQLADPAVRAGRSALLWAAVERVRCPVLVLRGADSRVFSDAAAEQLCRRLPDARWRRVSDAGHTIQGDNPRATVDELMSFLRARCAAPADGQR